MDEIVVIFHRCIRCDEWRANCKPTVTINTFGMICADCRNEMTARPNPHAAPNFLFEKEIYEIPA